MQACCDDRTYRILIEDRAQCYVEQCWFCGRRHYVIRAPAIVVGAAINGPPAALTAATEPLTSEAKQDG